MFTLLKKCNEGSKPNASYQLTMASYQLQLKSQSYSMSSCHILLDHTPLSQHWRHHVSYFPRPVAPLDYVILGCSLMQKQSITSLFFCSISKTDCFTRRIISYWGQKNMQCSADKRKNCDETECRNIWSTNSSLLMFVSN